MGDCLYFLLISFISSERGDAAVGCRDEEVVGFENFIYCKVEKLPRESYLILSLITFPISNLPHLKESTPQSNSNNNNGMISASAPTFIRKNPSNGPPFVQPPRRNKPPPPAPPTAAVPKKPASKLAKRLGLDVDEETEIREAWEMFIDKDASEGVGEYVIPTADVRRAMM